MYKLCTNPEFVYLAPERLTTIHTLDRLITMALAGTLLLSRRCQLTANNQEATWKSSLRSRSAHVEGEVIVIDEAVLMSVSDIRSGIIQPKIDWVTVNALREIMHNAQGLCCMQLKQQVPDNARLIRMTSKTPLPLWLAHRRRSTIAMLVLNCREYQV